MKYLKDLAATHSTASTACAPDIRLLQSELCTHVNTITAGQILGRMPQTLRKWQSQGNGPLRAVLVHGRLMWPVAKIRNLLSGSAA